MELSKYVFYSVDYLNEGCCVLVGDYLITAGHIVSRNDTKIVVEGSTYTLSKEIALFYQCDADNMNGNSYDIAIFKLPSLSSPIKFDTSTPCVGMKLKSISYEHGAGVKNESNQFAFKVSNEYMQLNECDAVITVVDGNFFECKTDIVLKPGSSGSPVFREGKVFGILQGGQPGQPYCVFQSSSSILKILNGLNDKP